MVKHTINIQTGISRGAARICVKRCIPFSVIIGEKKYGHLINPQKSEFYPNISTLLQIFTTLPCSCTRATEERSFSTLRRLSRFLRSGPYPDLRLWGAKNGNSKFFNFEKYLRKLINFEWIFQNFWENLKKIWKILKNFWEKFAKIFENLISFKKFQIFWKVLRKFF